MLQMGLTLGTMSPHLVAEELLITNTEAKLPTVLREAGACKHSSMHKRERLLRVQLIIVELLVDCIWNM